MAQHSMFGPDASAASSSAARELTHPVVSEDGSAFESDVAGLAAKFVEHAAGQVSPEVSADLALEIVLNEIVERACQVTGATGAAIVLERDGEMVCRATSGANAPELGVRLDTEAGLSGACVQSRQVQHCDDVLTDPRADAVACQQLGVRSLVILPLIQEGKLVGVFELFSCLPSAFGTQDEHALETLAQRVLRNLKRAAEPLNLIAPDAEISGDFADREGDFGGMFSTASEGKKPAQARDAVTLILAGIVLGCVVLLGSRIAVRMGWQTKHLTRRSVASAVKRDTAAANLATDASTAAGQGLAGAEKSSGPPAAGKPLNGSAAPPGSLLVYENGKEVFRLPPSSQGVDPTGGGQASSHESPRIVELAPDAVEDNLVKRVEPDYPDAAREQRVQGAVVLKVRISRDGSVASAELVSGIPALVEAATKAVMQWKFKPHFVDGRAVEMETDVTINFRLPQSP